MANRIGWLIALVMACGGSSPPAIDKVAAPVAAPKATAPDGMLELAEITFVEDNETVAAIHRDGTIEREGKKAGRVTAAGEFALPDGKVVFHLLANGELRGVNNWDFGITIDDTGTAKINGTPIEVDANGVLTGWRSTRIVGATGAKQRRTALFVICALMLPTSNAPYDQLPG